uniref:Uncharacterized protein n=1 Tax=Ascaris lumbricoides TaxID=6252 RepID=A0A0M3HVK8_ASCLU
MNAGGVLALRFAPPPPPANPKRSFLVNTELCCASRTRRSRQTIVVKVPSTYQAIGAIAELPTMSYQILTPSAPRRKLPQVPIALALSPTQSSVMDDEISSDYRSHH